VRLNPSGFLNTPYYRQERVTLIMRCLRKVPEDSRMWMVMPIRTFVCFSLRTSTLVLRNFDMTVMPLESTSVLRSSSLWVLPGIGW
jgi:hypothetical protein